MKRRNVIILIVLLIVGFASVSASLTINGFFNLAFNHDDFDVIFIDANLSKTEKNEIYISENKKTISFTTDRLSKIDETVRMNYKIKNISNQYDADVLINCTNELEEYLTVQSVLDNYEMPLEKAINIKAQEIKQGYINIELSKAYAGEDRSVKISCNIVSAAVSRETYAYSLKFNSEGGSQIDYKSVVLNESFGELETPEKEGYTFLGWYDDNDFLVDENTTLNSKGDKNLHAKWEANTYSVNIVTKENGKAEKNILDVVYDNTSTIKITPNNNYYLSSVDCDNGYLVENYNPLVPIYEEQEVTIRNNKTTLNGTCTFIFSQGIFEFNYTGSSQDFLVPLNGEYRFEVYGAGGNNTVNGGAGSSTSGSRVNATSILKKDTNLYVYIGQKEGAFNGGGSGGRTLNGVSTSTHGSGASDIRLIKATSGSWYDQNHKSWNEDVSLLSRIITAGGGAGAKVTAGRRFNGATPLNTYFNTSSILYATYSRDKARSNKTLGLGSSEATGTSRLTDTGDIGNGASGGGGGGYYGGQTSAANHSYVYSQFVNFMKQNSSGKTGGFLAINGNRLIGTEVHSHSGTSYINKGYSYNGYTYNFENTSITEEVRNGHGYAKITLIKVK